MAGWVLTISYVNEDGSQNDSCWAIPEVVAVGVADQLGTPSREYMSSPEVNAARLKAEEGSVVIINDGTT